MSWFAKYSRDTGNDSRSGIDAFTFLFSYYLVPIAIAAISVLVAVLPEEIPSSQVATPLPMRVLGDSQARLDIATAADALRHQPLRNRFDTHRQESPIWFSVEVPPASEVEQFSHGPSRLSAAVMFPSKHIREIECFGGSTFSLVGRISRNGIFSGDLLRAGAGVAIQPGHYTDVICRAVFSGPGLLEAYTASVDDLKRINDTFHRRAGLLEGGLATLAAFVFVAAVINRDWVYVLFAAWLFGNLRLGAISMGWDEQWLGSLLPLPWVSLIRKMTVPVYYILTYTLFVTLFRNDLARVGYRALLRTIQVLGPVLLLASIILPVPTYLPIMWGVVSIGVVAVIFLLTRLLSLAPSRTAIWYSLALATALLSSLSEVVSAAFKTHIPALNSVTAALVSSLMAALAIAEQIRAERAERLRAQAELSRAYGATPIGLFSLSANGELVQWNPALGAMLEIADHVTSAHWDNYFAPDIWKRIYNKAMDAGEVETELSRVNSSPAKGTLATLPEGATSSPSDEAQTFSKQGSGNIRHYVLRAAYDGTRLECSLQDVTERQEAIQTLQFLAEHDPLTGALNRRGLDKYIELTNHTENHVSRAMVLAYLDLDRFKLINDLFGHHIGDAVLRQVCHRIETGLDSRGRICRAGGDEFVILFAQTPLIQASVISQAIIDAIGDTPYEIDHRAFNVRASLGLVEAPAGVSPQEVISAADSACRQAKLEGNGRIVVYGNDTPMFEERARHMQLLKQFSSDRPPSGLYLEMQPIMSMTTPYDALDFEVLLRMRGSDGAPIPPAKAIMAAETNGTISAIDKWVMETTLTWIDKNRSRLSRTRFVSVNVSAASLNDERFVKEVGVLFHRFRHIVPLLCIEITEGVALHDLANTRRLIGSVQRLGAKVALDDFGAGYTSFPYLRDLPADALKIDGEFIKNISGSPENAAIAEAIIGLARNLGMQSIAEWVEDASTLEVLQTMGVDHVQGFAIARPQSPDVILSATSAADFITDPVILAIIGPKAAAVSADDDSLQSLH